MIREMASQPSACLTGPHFSPPLGYFFNYLHLDYSIVTIHGLTGHFMKTWTTEDDVCWPRDLLPKMTTLLGTTRVMTFGYAAGQLGTKLDLDIEDAAWQLIHGLEKVRSTPEVGIELRGIQVDNS